MLCWMQDIKSIVGQNHHFTQAWEHVITYSSSPLFSSHCHQRSLCLCWWVFGSGSSHLQSLTLCFPGQNCVILICFHLPSHASLAVFFSTFGLHFYGPFLWHSKWHLHRNKKRRPSREDKGMEAPTLGHVLLFNKDPSQAPSILIWFSSNNCQTVPI